MTLRMGMGLDVPFCVVLNAGGDNGVIVDENEDVIIDADTGGVLIDE